MKCTFFYLDATAPSGPGPPHCRGFAMVLGRTRLGRTPLDERSAWRRHSCLTAHSSHKTQTASTRLDSNLQSQQAIRPLESALHTTVKMNTQVYGAHFVFIQIILSAVSITKRNTELCVWRLTGHYASVLKTVVDVKYTLAGLKLCHIYINCL